MELTESDITLFWSKVVKKGTNECWEWNGGHSNGYCTFRLVSLPIDIHAHRIMYYLKHHIWSDKYYVIDHQCRNRGCINPDHLQRTTRTGNGYNTNQRTSCSNGHVYELDGVKIVSGKRICISCEKIRHQRYFNKIGGWKREET